MNLPTRTLFGLVSAAFAFIFSSVVAAVWISFRRGFGRGDLSTLGFWNGFFALGILAVSSGLAKFLLSNGILRRSPFPLLVGGAYGFIFTMLIGFAWALGSGHGVFPYSTVGLPVAPVDSPFRSQLLADWG